MFTVKVKNAAVAALSGLLAVSTFFSAYTAIKARAETQSPSDGVTTLCANYSGASSERTFKSDDSIQLGAEHINFFVNNEEVQPEGLADALQPDACGNIFTAEKADGKTTLDLKFDSVFGKACVLDRVTVFYDTIGYTTEFHIGDGEIFNRIATVSTASTTEDMGKSSYHSVTSENNDGFSVLRLIIYGGNGQYVRIRELDVDLKNDPREITEIRDELRSEISVSPLFFFFMILKQRSAVKVTGYGGGKNGNTVTVTIGGQTKTAAVENYEWSVTLDPLPAGTDYELKISGPSNTVTIKNVAVGEIFIAAGQSNMQRTVGKLDGATDEDYIKGYGTEQISELKQTPNANLRLFNQSTVGSRNESLTTVKSNGWSIADFDSAYDFSAVGYFFGRELQNTLKVPVGIIYAAVGGSRIQAWYSRQALLASDDQTLLNEQTECIDFYSGDNPGYFSQSACNYFNGMIKPLSPYAVSGVLWYQGESNVGDYKIYHKLMEILEDCWREAFEDPDLPFLLSQVAPLDKSGYNHHRIAVMQTEMTYLLHNTFITTISDTPWEEGNTNIHPQNKIPVAERLAALARQFVYGEDINSLPPMYNGVVFDGDTAIISFANAESGLSTADGDDPEGFEISDDGKTFLPASATIVDGNKIAVWNGGISSPKFVRYGYDPAFTGNLFSDDGLPVSIFATDMLLFDGNAERKFSRRTE